MTDDGCDEWDERIIGRDDCGGCLQPRKWRVEWERDGQTIQMKSSFTWAMTVWRNVEVEGWHPALLMLAASQRLAWRKERKNDKWGWRARKAQRVDCSRDPLGSSAVLSFSAGCALVSQVFKSGRSEQGSSPCSSCLKQLPSQLFSATLTPKLRYKLLSNKIDIELKKRNETEDGI